MYSLDLIRDSSDLRKYYRRFSELRHEFSPDVVDQFYLDCKLLGVAVQILYRDHKLISARTKTQDADKGYDITKFVAALPNVPIHIQTGKTVIVRGDILVYLSDFYIINHDRIANKLEPFNTTVDCVLDTLQNHGPEMVKPRSLRFYAWELYVVDSLQKPLCHADRIQFLTRFGFNTPRGQLCTNIDEMLGFINETARIKTTLPYEIDGVVIKQNDPAFTKAMGVKNGVELGKAFWKFNDDGVIATVDRIDWSILRTGQLVPTVMLKPTVIEGIPINHINLICARDVEEQHLGKGAKVHVVKIGDTKPKIIKTIHKTEETGVPTTCPCCGKPLTTRGEHSFCTNTDCPGILLSTLEYIVSPFTLNVPALTKDKLKLMLDKGMIKSLIDIFSRIESTDKSIKQDDLDTLVTRARNINFLDLIMLLGIEAMGKAIAGKIAIDTGNVQGLINLLESKRQMRLLPLNEMVKNNLTNWYAQPGHKEFLLKIAELHLPRCS